MLMSHPERSIHVAAISGSLREGSYNTGLLRAAAEVAPPEMHIEVFDLHNIPMYDSALDNDADRPTPVRALKRAIDEADAMLFASPEYNHSISGVLKNAIDWASRPAGRSPMAGKPAAIMGATTGIWGTVRMQEHLRDILTATGSPVVLKPHVLVASARKRFDEDGNLLDEQTREFIAQLMRNLAEEVRMRQAYHVAETI
jgi:chromate reductase